jgi:hypothetical protein
MMMAQMLQEEADADANEEACLLCLKQMIVILWHGSSSVVGKPKNNDCQMMVVAFMLENDYFNDGPRHLHTI